MHRACDKNKGQGLTGARYRANIADIAIAPIKRFAFNNLCSGFESCGLLSAIRLEYYLQLELPSAPSAYHCGSTYDVFHSLKGLATFSQSSLGNFIGPSATM